MKKKFGNSKATQFLAGFEDLVSLDDKDCDLSLRCKFNFSYFVKNQEYSGVISDWDIQSICDFFDKLVDFSCRSIGQMQQIGMGKNRYSLLSFYECYPKNSYFTKPKNIPHQARWGRIRLDQNKRLIGFVIPDEYHDLKHKMTEMMYDKNTFYVVFIDNNHKFYPLK